MARTKKDMKKAAKKAVRPKIYTIGHSNRTEVEFLELLKLNRVRQLVDIRTIPRSAFNPQFNADALMRSLGRVGITYVPMASLGGFRRARPDSPNTGWQNASFRGYADFMATGEFKEALGVLEKLARRKCTALMCAEAVPWRCHRALVADALMRDRFAVYDITGKGEPKRHKKTPFARVRKGQIVYLPPRGSETIPLV